MKFRSWHTINIVRFSISSRCVKMFTFILWMTPLEEKHSPHKFRFPYNFKQLRFSPCSDYSGRSLRICFSDTTCSTVL